MGLRARNSWNVPSRLEGRRAWIRSVGGALLREPTVWFFVFAALVLAASRSGRENTGPSLLPREELRARLVAELLARNGRAPSEDEVRSAWPDFLDREILYREALALGLDRDDEIVRRRLIQKMEFLLEGAAPEEPERPEELLSFWQRYRHRYREAGRVSFTHVFLGEQNIPAERAAAVLAELRRGGEVGKLSRPFLPGLVWRNRSLAEVEAAFGAGFAQALPPLPVGTWSGPIRSSFGWHLVRLEDSRPARIVPLEEIRERVLEDWREEARKQARNRALAQLRAKYQVEVEAPAPSGEKEREGAQNP